MPQCTLECTPLAGNDGIALYYNEYGECYTAREGGNYVCAVRFELSSSDTDNAIEIHFWPRPSTDPLAYEAPTRCPSTSGAATPTDLGYGHVKVSYPVPSTSGIEWGWDYGGPTPPKLAIKIRVKRT